MITKLLLQVLLLLGCWALAVSVVESLLGNARVVAEDWWRGAMTCWMLVVAIRMVYPAHAK